MKLQTTVLVAFLYGFGAMAQNAQPPQPDQKLGWKRSANLGVNLSFTSSQDVVGQTNGSTENYGFNLKGSLDHVQEHDEWRNGLSILGSTTRTPKLPRWVKTGDEWKYTTLYTHQFPDSKFGPYVRGEVAAPAFNGEDVRDTPTTYRISRRGQADQLITQSTLHLTDPFKPLTTKEGLGLLWKTIDSPRFSLEMRGGLAGLQVLADGQYSVTGTDPAGDVLVNELYNVDQWGAELSVAGKGKIQENSAYEFGLTTMTPFYTNKDQADSRSNWTLTDVDGFLKLTSNITSWASFSYDYKLKYEPQLLEKAQQIHLIVMNINYNLF